MRGFISRHIFTAARPALVLAIVLVALAACGGGNDEPRPTPLPPEMRAATSTASAIETEARKAPCVVSPYTRSLLREVADELWAIGTDLGTKGQGSLGLQFYEALTAYGLLTECREVGGTPVAEGSPSVSPSAYGAPFACLDPERTIDRLRLAAVKGGSIAFTAAFQGIKIDSLPTLAALSQQLAKQANDLAIACGIRSAGTPSPAATS